MGQVVHIEKERYKRLTQYKRKTKELLNHAFIKQRGILYIISFLLGRSIILFDISPFGLAFLATIAIIERQRIYSISAILVLGAWSFSLLHGIFITIAVIIFLIFLQVIEQKASIAKYATIIFIAIATSRLFLSSVASQVTIYDMTLIVAESLLAILLLFIFLQSLPMIILKKYTNSFRNEDLICFVIFIAAILIGVIGLLPWQIGVEHILSRYLVLIVALVGGAAIGSTVGVVLGLILSLANVINIYQLTLLAFAGLLGGLLQEGKKPGVSIGLLVGTLLIALYGDSVIFSYTVIESFSAILLLYLTPMKWTLIISKYIPGTFEYSYEERKYLQKLRDITAKRVEQFSDVFSALSKSFIQATDRSNEVDRLSETDYFLSLVTEKTCQNCFMKKRCWLNNFDTTYGLMESIKNDLILHRKINAKTINQFENHCVKSKTVLHAITEEVSLVTMQKQLKQQVVESKRIVAEQLRGVSEVMEDFAKEIVKEQKQHEKQEILIMRALKEMNIKIERLDIFELEKGRVDIDMAVYFPDYHGEAAKLIAPVLSDILQETIIVLHEKISPLPHVTSQLSFGSAQKYKVDTGIAIAAKGGGLISGDAYTTIELGRGKYALAISDGMGNGIRAREESMETLRLLRQILQTGMSEQVAIKSINSILALRTTDEIFATLDLAIINLHDASLRCLKIGSSPSFIKRKNDVIHIEAQNLPMGIIEHVDLEAVSDTLKANDILVMISDGIIDGLQHVINKELWVQRKIRELKTDDPQEIADILLEEAVRASRGVISDDMTVVVAKIVAHQPEWAAIPVLNFHTAEA